MQSLSFLSMTSYLNSRLGRLVAATSLVLILTACQDKTSEEHILEAQQFAESGNTSAAVVALKNAVQKAPQSANARFELGKLYLELDSYESAEKELSRALELGYDQGVVTPMLATALQRTGANVALADLEYDEANLTSAQQMEVGFRRLNSLVELEKEREAKNLINDLLKLNTDTVYRGLVEAYDDVLREDLADALEKAKAMYERAPLNRDVLNMTARLYQLNGLGEEASNIYSSYVEVAPKDLESKFALAKMLVEQKQSERAEVYIDELLEVAENNPYLNQLKGIVRAADNDFKNAKLYAEKAVSAGRNDPSNRLVAGLASYQLEDYESAIRHISMIATFLPDDHPGLRILAASQLKSNMGDDAGEILSRVNAVDGEDASLFSRAGYELIRSGNTEAARDVIEQADKISQTSKDLTRLGILKLSLNDVEGLVDLEKAVEKAPESATAKTTLASAYLGTDQLEKAMQLAKQWQSDEPSAIEALLLEAEVLQRQDKLAEADVVITKALTQDSDSVAARVAQVRLEIRRKNYDVALSKTEAVLNDEPTSLPALASYFALKRELGQTEEAINYLEEAANDNPDNANIAILFARVAVNFNRSDDAVKALSKIEPTRTAPVSYWPVKGIAHIRTNQADAALDHYNTWAKLFPNQENAVLGQLLMMDVKRQYKQGADIATSFLERKDNLQVKIMQSYFLAMTKDLSGAKAVYESIDERYKALPFLRGVSARISLLEGDPEKALEDAKVAYEENTTLNNLILYVSALDRTNNTDKSLEMIQQYVNKFPDDGRAKLLLGERQIDADETKAIATYKDMLKTYPNNFVVLNNLAHLQMKTGQLDQAYRNANKAFGIQPDNVAIADTYAQVLLKQNKTDEAVQIYNRVMSDEVNNDEISLNYIEALLKNKSITIAERRIASLKLQTDEGKARLDALKDEYLN